MRFTIDNSHNSPGPYRLSSAHSPVHLTQEYTVAQEYAEPLRAYLGYLPHVTQPNIPTPADTVINDPPPVTKEATENLPPVVVSDTTYWATSACLLAILAVLSDALSVPLAPIIPALLAVIFGFIALTHKKTTTSYLKIALVCIAITCGILITVEQLFIICALILLQTLRGLLL